ncbi:CHAT domain-containing protein [Laspinema sp. D1]|uniref:CHAT domain-containing protein n=1 Tax=Laspinema palackyanum D2a TaxID=2953684 RepID=A0ABT2MMA9_9CYAN|nr:CHAT domain-containing protein [Laspinema sp. D2a]
MGLLTTLSISTETLSTEVYSELIDKAIKGDITAAERAVQIAPSNSYRSKAVIILANLVQTNDPNRAIRLYQSIINQTDENDTYIMAQLNLLSLLIKQQPVTEQILEIIDELKHGISTDSERIHFSYSLIQIELYQEALNILNQVSESKFLSYSLGLRARTNELQGNIESAKDIFYQAYAIAESQQDSEALFRWAWGLARTYSQMDNTESAILMYSDALSHIKFLSLDFEEIEPIYQEFLDILLKPDASTEQLQLAQSVIEQKQSTEVSIFFDEICLESDLTFISSDEPDSIMIYPILLPNRLMILSVRDNTYQLHQVSITEAEFQQFTDNFYENIQDIDSKEFSEKLYDWLIKPLNLSGEVKTLIFRLDNQFRRLPLATMHDGESYAITRYEILISQGLLSKPKTIKNEILAGGITESHQAFNELPKVEVEIETIQQLAPHSLSLLNQDFTLENLRKRLEKNYYPIVHLATHGKFSSSFEETFLLTWNGKLNIRELEKLLTLNSKPIELLVLSACETAVGDEKATLGLAGLAARAGARFTLATLWAVDDEATALFMNEFYKYLFQHGLSPSESLSKAQLNLINTPRFSHPFFWAGFVLIGQ